VDHPRWQAWKDAGVPNLRTMVTELGTGLGMLGEDDLDEVLESRSAVMRSLSPEHWDQLRSVRAGGAYDAEFHAAWLNGRTFLTAREGLRDRRPELVEWKGVVRGSGDEVAPIDLRIDHVYLVSCKYMSDILFNVSPTHIFDSVLAGGTARRGRGAGGDWYAEVAPREYQRLYDAVRGALRSGGVGISTSAEPRPARDAEGLGPLALPGLGRTDTGDRPSQGVVAQHSATTLRDLPHRAVDLTSAHRTALGLRLKAGWPGGAKEAYRELSDEVARVSVVRWHAALSVGTNAGEAMLWRLLRMGSAPYFVLGSSAARSLRLRIATPWDWKQLFRLIRLEVFAQQGGQPRVGWLATVRERASGQLQEVSGHVEVRWSHGRFGGLPEAKGYLDTRHHLVPGYFPLQ
jgi:hypothetical protein